MNTLRLTLNPLEKKSHINPESSLCGFHSGEYLPPKKGRQAKPALRSKVMSYSFPEPFRSIPPKQGFSAIQFLNFFHIRLLMSALKNHVGFEENMRIKGWSNCYHMAQQQLLH